jgi:hypothetical protein
MRDPLLLCSVRPGFSMSVPIATWSPNRNLGFSSALQKTLLAEWLFLPVFIAKQLLRGEYQRWMLLL